MKTLYEKEFEHDNCGIGAVVNIDGTKSRRVVDCALSIVEKLEHRAGKDASGETGDGVGILLQISHNFFKREMKEMDLGEERDYGIGMFFFPVDEKFCNDEKARFEDCCAKSKLEFLGWRKVPVNADVLGKKARDCMPNIFQAFIKRPENIKAGFEFDRELYKLRLLFEKTVPPELKKLENGHTYVCSLSSRTIVYKGMFLVKQLRTFYSDLQSEEYVSALGIVHSRFSTNTNPSWQRAHPNRFIAHNGEINTIRGNVDRMIARNGEVDVTGSDSAMLDNTLEYLVMNGMELPLAVTICIPEPWKNNDAMSEEKRDFYHYWATMMESWDGPAAILFSDGDVLGATLDRNGLRPSRYYITKDGMLILSSEVGVLDIPENQIEQKSCLMPGKMLLVDINAGRLISDEEIKTKFATEHPYGEWLDQNTLKLSHLKVPNKKIPVSTQEERDQLYYAFGWKFEDINEMILPMASNGVEPTGAMGVDTPLACMSAHHPPLFNYFKQLFAQVTNPPIDSLREKIVTDTTIYVGTDGDILTPESKNCRVLEINNPILTGVDVIKIKALNTPHLRTKTISLLIGEEPEIDENAPPPEEDLTKPAVPPEFSLEKALDDLFEKIDEAYAEGYNIIILSDRGLNKYHVAIPSLLAVSAVEQYLIRTKRRTKISIILESGEIRNVHQAAMCLGYGARAVNPYLAHECISELIDKKILDKDYHTAINDFNKAIIDGIVKISAKMGISTIQSYQSSQIFEAVGISKKVIDKYFTNTISRVEGIGLKEMEEDILYHYERAWNSHRIVDNAPLEYGGYHRFRQGPNVEDHICNPKTIKVLQESTRSGDYVRFKEYTSMIDDNTYPHTLRAMLAFNYPADGGIPLDEVESVESIVQRFKTGAMSYGSISEEAHKCLAEAMNNLHGKSNSGEGGEKPERLGTIYNSAIKQVASGRFGVTEEYLLSAEEIQIKMAQGAKPGEGGHLPGKKVYPWIAKTRYATPGVSLISPPPHHDIYSIEDLAQLIYDLKNANRKANISVKLVSETGVGTIACGVAKAGAQVILISGHDGGTGAAPYSSIHHAGLPWELGVAETHQSLIQNGLRSRVRIETDGKLMSGRDVAIACLLGAQEFGFATAPLIVMGCAMLRICNLDTCPFGVATQNDKLRKKFPGKPEYVENFMRFIAQELREYMAKLGVHTVDEMCGRIDLLKMKEEQGFSRADLIDLSRILVPVSDDWKKSKEKFDFALQNTLDEKVLLPSFEQNQREGKKILLKSDLAIQCTDRTTGTILGSEIQRKFGNSLEEDTFEVKFTGGAGQSFGAFIPKGLTLYLEGDANDYLGKGLSGGKIIIKKPKAFTGNANENMIIGNVALFGATSGKAFINGIAGERFCVRNSGATAVVEGTGDHGLEYMTGGTVVILGETGKNLAAGMSGGVAYVLDENHSLYKKLNKGLVNMYDLNDETTTLRKTAVSSTSPDVENLRKIIQEHVESTGSEIGTKILENWEEYIPKFKKIIPNDYLRMYTEIYAGEERGLSHDDAVMEAFRKITKGA